MIKVFRILMIGVVSFWGADVTKAQAQTRIQKQFDTWVVNCNEDLEGNKICALNQPVRARLNEQSRLSTVFTFSIRLLEDERRMIRLATPLGIVLGQGVSLQFEEQEPRRIALSTCRKGGCIARFIADEEWLQLLSVSETLSVEYLLEPNRRVAFDMPLSGFSAALAYLASQN